MEFKVLNVTKLFDRDNDSDCYIMEYTADRKTGYEIFRAKKCVLEKDELTGETHFIIKKVSYPGYLIEFIGTIYLDKFVPDLKPETLEKILRRYPEDELLFLNARPEIEQCGEFLRRLVESCKESDAHMWFEESETMGKSIIRSEDLNNQIKKFSLEKSVNINDYCIIIYFDAVTKFLF